MKNTCYFLSTCNTCKRIMKTLNITDEHWVLKDLKHQAISEEDLEAAFQQTASYEALFNKRARKYISQGLNKKLLSEEEFKSLILSEYTFLKRPVIFYNGAVFIGNSKAEVERLKQALKNE
ncbi:MAG: arsenate reductase family protein [Flavobacteriales bacterium]